MSKRFSLCTFNLEDLSTSALVLVHKYLRKSGRKYKLAMNMQRVLCSSPHENTIGFSPQGSIRLGLTIQA
eukprot:scaffold226499_cov16-Tisochrysis_lutea.AAC.1